MNSKKNIRSDLDIVKTFEKAAETTVLLGVSAMFVGYALVVYPVEKLSNRFNPAVQKEKVKYASPL